MELQPLKIHFYLKQRDKGNKACELYMRMVMSGRRTDISLSYALKRDAWDEKEQTLKLKHPDRSYVLGLTNKYRQKAMEEYQQLIQRGMAYDINIIRQKITGYNAEDPSSEPTLLRLFNRIIDRKIKMLGQKNTKGTIQKYNRCRKHLIDFIKKQYHTDDMRFNHISLEFIEDFELYLKTDGSAGRLLSWFVSQLKKTNESGNAGKFVNELSPTFRYLSVEGRVGGRAVRRLSYETRVVSESGRCGRKVKGL